MHPNIISTPKENENTLGANEESFIPFYEYIRYLFECCQHTFLSVHA
jgi:hypothetical protein